MRNRSLAITLTVIAILLLGCPGLTVLCLGITGFIAFYSNGYQYYNVSPGWVNALGTLGICVGLFLIVITIIAVFFLLRKKKEVIPSSPVQPIPPTGPDQTVTSTSIDQSVPPTSPDQPVQPTSPDEPIPPSI